MAIVHPTIAGLKTNCFSKPAMSCFPEGDTLGVVFNFLSARELLRGQLCQVSKEWRRVLREVPHAWGISLDLSWATRFPTPPFTFAWHRVSVR